MERNGVDPINKKNSKLETFLKRNLDSDAYDRIRYHESCIVLSDKQPKLDKALCFVVVGHDFIYLTENPPKTIRAEAPYRNVLNIELKNDFPNFLGGEERENTLHIAITHLVEDAPKSRKAKKSDSDDLERSSFLPTQLDSYGKSDSAISSSNLVTPRAGGSSPNLPRKSSRTSPRLPRRCSSSTQQSVTDTQKLKRSGSWDEDQFLRSFDDDLNLESIMSPRLANSAPHHALRPPDRLVVRSNGMLCTPPSRTHKRTGSEISDTSSSGGSSELKGLNLRKSSSVSEDGAGTPRPLPSPSFQRKMPLPTAASVPNDLVLLGEKKGKQKKGKDKSKTKREDEFIAEVSEETKHDIDIVVTSMEPEYPGMRKCTSDIYMMAYNSPILTFMKNAWDNYKIRGTLLEDPVFEANHNSKKTPGIKRRSMSGEKLDALYGQLKQEILSLGNNMEEVFSLIHELKVASERNFAIKKLFWKSPDLFHFMVRQLQLYLPSSPTNMSTDDGKNQRADELELVNLILEALAFMFRETENLTTRSAALKQQKGKVVNELLLLLTSTPETPQRHKPKMSRAAALLLMTPNDQRNAITDSELNKLVAEFTNQTTTVLFELMLVAQQNREKDGINLNLVMKTLEESQSTETFVKRLIAIAMHLLSPSTKVELLPKEAVLLYQQFSVLATLTMYSVTLCKSIRDNYFEEFKYYIQAPVIMNKLPTHFPITKPTLAVMEKVISKVLQKDFKFTMVQRKMSSQSLKSVK